MSEMIERVARAIFETYGKEEGLDGGWDDVLSAAEIGAPIATRWRDLAFKEARAAIEAMREPTTEMLDLGPPEPYMDNDTWARMIGGAL